jgi:hypothetical protein
VTGRYLFQIRRGFRVESAEFIKKAVIRALNEDIPVMVARYRNDIFSQFFYKPLTHA